MKLYIPEISDELRLVSEWTFDLYNEDRNQSMMTKIGDVRETAWRNMTTIPCTIPAGAILVVDRIYIRKGLKDYSSVTFRWKGESIPGYTKERIGTNWTGFCGSVREDYTYTERIPKRPIRFWAKLSDVNNIEFEKVND